MSKQKPDIFRGFRFIPDRLGFSVQIQIIVNTVNIQYIQHTYNVTTYAQFWTFLTASYVPCKGEIFSISVYILFYINDLEFLRKYNFEN